MKAEDLVLLGVKNTVVAFRRDNGECLWSADVGSALMETFVTLIADESRVFVHSGGEIRCLDLFSGQEIWKNGLSGFGYGIATLAFTGHIEGGVSPAAKSKQNAGNTASSTTITATPTK